MKNLIKINVALSLFLLTFIVSAQEADPNALKLQESEIITPVIESPRIEPPINPIIVSNKLKKDEEPIQVSNLNIEIKVIDTIAVTTVDLEVFNPNHRILEGELNFPLTEQQSVSGFGLDINGKMREGVPVTKAKGQEAFEDVVRQNIDPALLEKTEGNNFRTRIYPIPANGSRHISLTFNQDLSVKDGVAIYQTPLAYADKVAKLTIKTLIYGEHAVEPKFDLDPKLDFKFEKFKHVIEGVYSGENIALPKDLKFELALNAQNITLLEKDNIAKDTVFYSKIYLPKYDVTHKVTNKTESVSRWSQFWAKKHEVTDKTEVKKIKLFWDNSLSSLQRDFKKELALLEAYLKQAGNLEVDVQFFNLELSPTKSFIINQGDAKELIAYLQQAIYDGATQLGVLDFSDKSFTEVLLFSDMLGNFADNNLKLGEIPVQVISSTAKVDAGRALYVAKHTGGNYLNLNNLTENDALNMLLQANYHLISAEYDKSQLSNLVFPQSKVMHDNFTLVGKILVPEATLKLNFGIGKDILHTEVIELKQADIEDYGNVLPKIWAGNQISELEQLYDEHKTEIEQLGKKYNIVTRNTSLIVLDRVEDYVKHEIEPPQELLANYQALLKQHQNNLERQNLEHQKHVAKQFELRKSWWNKKFPKGKSKNIQPENDELESHADSAITQSGSVPVRTSAARPSSANSTDVVSLAAAEQKSGSMNMNSNTKEVFNANSVPKQSLNTATIKLQNWNPNSPYITKLKNTPAKYLYEEYLRVRKDYQETPSFYLEVAEFFIQKQQKQQALLILSNLAELNVQDYRLLRVLAHRLKQLEYNKYAIKLFEKVLELRPEEPQSYRDLALAYAQDSQYQLAIDSLYKIVERSWNNRFPNVEIIALEELNAIIKYAEFKKLSLDLTKINPKFIFAMPLDIRIVLNWDTDNSDMDLWVIDPNNEKVYYHNELSYIGGMISDDFTGGYGPEEFLLKEAISGQYRIKADYFGSRQQTLIGPTTIYLDIYTDYATTQEKKQTITLRLTEAKEIIDIGEIMITKPKIVNQQKEKTDSKKKSKKFGKSKPKAKHKSKLKSKLKPKPKPKPKPLKKKFFY